MAWFGYSEDRPPAAPKGPATWGLVGGLLGLAFVLLAAYGPALIAVGVLLTLGAAAGMASGVLEEAAAERRDRLECEQAPRPDLGSEPTVDFNPESVAPGAETGPRFRERLSGVSPPAGRRLH